MMQDRFIAVWNVLGLEDAKVKLKSRTSNGLERYNRHFNGIVPRNHPNLLAFVHALEGEIGRVLQRIENVEREREEDLSYSGAIFPEILAEFFVFAKKGKKRGGKVRKKAATKRRLQW